MKTPPGMVIRFNGQVSFPTTTDGETVAISFHAANEGELHERLTEATRVLRRRMREHNREILAAADNIERRKDMERLDIHDELSRRRKGGANGGTSPGPAHP